MGWYRLKREVWLRAEVKCRMDSYVKHGWSRFPNFEANVSCQHPGISAKIQPF